MDRLAERLGLIDEKDSKAGPRIRSAFQAIARSSDGQTVLSVLFYRLGLLDLIRTEDERIRHNVAVDILRVFADDTGGSARMSDVLVNHLAGKAGSEKENQRG